MIMKNRRFHIIVLVLMAASAGWADANTERWKNMTEAERAEFRRRMESMTPEQMEQLRARKQKFDQLEPEERERIRVNQQRYKQMSQEYRSRMGGTYKRYQRMSEEERQQMREQLMEKRRALKEQFRKQREERMKAAARRRANGAGTYRNRNN